MFDHQHYVPVMRMKPAELRALKALEATLRLVTTPLLECPPRVLRGCDARIKIERRAARLVEYLVGWTRQRLFLDFSMLSPQMGSPALTAVAREMTMAGIRPVLVVSLKSGEQSPYTRAVRDAQDRFGATICLRISPEELKLSGSEDLIRRRLEHFGSTPASVDLVVDRGGVDGGSFRYEEFAGLIPAQDSWRTITCLAGSFPEDLSRLSRGQIHRLPRVEWRQWRSLHSWPGRRPAFGDYAIQHVVPKEPVAVPNYSASIRYTVENEFVVLRGEGVLNEQTGLRSVQRLGDDAPGDARVLWRILQRRRSVRC